MNYDPHNPGPDHVRAILADTLAYLEDVARQVDALARQAATPITRSVLATSLRGVAARLRARAAVARWHRDHQARPDAPATLPFTPTSEVQG